MRQIPLPLLAAVAVSSAAAPMLSAQAPPAGTQVTGVSSGSAAVEQTTHGAAAGRIRLVQQFDGLGEGFVGPHGAVTLRNPSDNSLAVGRAHVVQTVNSQWAVFRKNGTSVYGPLPTNAVFRGFGGPCETMLSGDAVVRYDQLADRWLLVLPVFRRVPAGHTASGPRTARLVIPAPVNDPAPRPAPPRAGPDTATGGYAMCYAVSATSDPLGAWHRYEFARPLFPDYPRPAVWPDGYYVPTSTGDDVIEKHVCVAERARMLRGAEAREQCRIVPNVNFLNTADLDGRALPPKGAPNLVLAAGGTQLRGVVDSDELQLWRFSVNWRDTSRTTFTGPERIAVAPYRYLCGGQLTNCVPQPGVERRLDAQGDKLMPRLVYRQFGARASLVATHSINTSQGAGGVRWYELRVGQAGAVTLYQQGTLAFDSLYRWLPSAAMDRFGNIGIGYSAGNDFTFAGQRFAGRSPRHVKGTLGFHEIMLATGAASQTTTLRWEDYTQTAVDPADDCTIWYVGDYFRAGATQYSTRIGAFRMPGCR
ncbi:hypothetical protein [Gemmatimonas sp.]|uniref:hypothetical protein n=1 Tax=Gemmatimonas sp. TaxID=1962908 RepID=UPI0027BA4B72|nr:hypothetical protein [Gemmatimonas sp.]